MPAIDDLKSRRSIRKYQLKTIPHKVIIDILEAASWAPSAHNAQPWRFIVLTNGTSKRELSSTMANEWAKDLAKDGQKIDEATFATKVERFAKAPVLILACLSLEDMHKQPDQERQSVERDLALESLGAAMQNLLIAAHTKGLGACWFCAPAFCKESVRKLLQIPDEIEPEALVAIGYPNESPCVPQRKSLKEFCYNERWGNNF